MSYAQIVGILPEELRGTFESPLGPEHENEDNTPGLKSVQRYYGTQDELWVPDEQLGAAYTDLFSTVATLGGISLQPDTVIQVYLVQGPSNLLGESLGRHTDNLGPHYIRALVCNTLGTIYETPTGDETTPDYAILRFDENAFHEPQLGPSSVIKTRLAVSRIPMTAVPGIAQRYQTAITR